MLLLIACRPENGGIRPVGRVELQEFLNGIACSRESGIWWLDMY